jgi:hypothetical protein
MTYSNEFTDSFTITSDTDSEMVIRQIRNGVESTLNPSSRLRNLASSTSTYTTSSADSLVIYYLATADIPSSSFLVVSSHDYTVNEINPIGELDDSPTTTEAEETSEPESIVGLVVATIIIVFLMVCIGSMACVWYKCSQKQAQRNYRDGNGNHVIQQSDQVEVLPFEVVQKLHQMQEFDYKDK